VTTLPPATLITTDKALADHVRAWADEPLLAIDTESNSLHAYREQVCLIQLSTREADFIIDPLFIEDLSPLGELLASPAIEKVFHAAEYDIMSLKRDFGFTFANLFDTMLAARICGSQQLGLAKMLKHFYGVTANKKHQRDNWGERPLTPEMLHYAQLDTHYLPGLRDHWREQLIAAGRWEEAREVFDALPHIPPVERHFDPEGYWRINGVHRLSPRSLSILRELYLFREEAARRHDVPPFKVFSDKTLLALAARQPRHTQDLYGIHGMTAGQIRRHGHGILRAVQQGRKRRPPSPPRPPKRPDDITTARYEALRNWRKHRALERGVESDIILPREALWELARRAPTTPQELINVPGLGPWKLQAYGEEILHVLARVNGHRNSDKR